MERTRAGSRMASSILCCSRTKDQREVRERSAGDEVKDVANLGIPPVGASSMSSGRMRRRHSGAVRAQVEGLAEVQGAVVIREFLARGGCRGWRFRNRNQLAIGIAGVVEEPGVVSQQRTW